MSIHGLSYSYYVFCDADYQKLDPSHFLATYEPVILNVH